VAAAVAATWAEIDDLLNPIIGRRGVAALYNRSLHLSEREHTWLGEGHAGSLAALNTEALQRALSLRPPMAAAQAAAAQLQSFHDLLSSLVGPSLTKHLLGSVWASAPGDTVAQDTPP
jgi:hypothetical protein